MLSKSTPVQHPNPSPAGVQLHSHDLLASELTQYDDIEKHVHYDGVERSSTPKEGFDASNFLRRSKRLLERIISKARSSAPLQPLHYKYTLVPEPKEKPPSRSHIKHIPNVPKQSPSVKEAFSHATNPSPLPSPPPTPKRNMQEEEEIRIEVSFERFERVVLSPALKESHTSHTALRGLARSIVSSSDWPKFIEPYRISWSKTFEDDDPDGDSIGHFMNLLNLICDFQPANDKGYAPHNPLFFGRPVYPVQSARSSRSSDDNTSEPLSAGSFVKAMPAIYMGVRRTGSTPVLSWANCAIVLQVHDAYDQRRERQVDPEKLHKRKESEYSSDSSRASKRHKRTESSSPSPPPSLSFARRSHASPQRIYGSDAYYPRFQSPPTPHIDTAITNCASAVFNATGTRRHVLGIHASGWNVRLYMFDRAGVIYTQPLNISLPHEARAFVAAVLSLQHLSPIQLGLNPFLTSLHCQDGPDTNPSSPSRPDISAVSGLTVNVNGAKFVTEDLIMCSWDMYGRGTTIFGVKPLSNPEACVATSTLHRQSQRKAREPSDFKENTALPHHHASRPLLPISEGERLVMKLSWHHLSRQSEDELLCIAQANGVAGVIQLYASCVAGRLSNGLRGKLAPKGMYFDRELRVQILGPRCVPLKHISNMEDFKEGFRSLVTAHHDLFEKAGILHRDISLDNLMVDASNHRRGILIDLDIAARVRDGGTRLKPNLAYAGTLGFRSIDLLQTNTHFPTRTIYRDDLESFFYVLLHILRFYREGKRLPVHDNSGWWRSDDGLKRLANLKGGFIRDPDPERLPDSPLSACWLGPLRDLLCDAYDNRAYACYNGPDEPPIPWTEEQEETLGGKFTFKEFMKTIA